MKQLTIVLVVILISLTIWLSLTVVRLENYRYANTVGMCDMDKFNGSFDDKKREQRACFDSVETRTNPFWHLYYALIG